MAPSRTGVGRTASIPESLPLFLELVPRRVGIGELRARDDGALIVARASRSSTPEINCVVLYISVFGFVELGLNCGP
jgi:hypothetical protein